MGALQARPRDGIGELGERETGSVRLNQAVAAYRDALGELTVDRVPLEWATIQNNLGNVFMALGGRETGTARLKEAASAYRNALTRQDRDHAPLEWAQM